LKRYSFRNWLSAVKKSAASCENKFERGDRDLTGSLYIKRKGQHITMRSFWWYCSISPPPRIVLGVNGALPQASTARGPHSTVPSWFFLRYFILAVYVQYVCSKNIVQKFPYTRQQTDMFLFWISKFKWTEGKLSIKCNNCGFGADLALTFVYFWLKDNTVFSFFDICTIHYLLRLSVWKRWRDVVSCREPLWAVVSHIEPLWIVENQCEQTVRDSGIPWTNHERH
jgi:hypothetical protein